MKIKQVVDLGPTSQIGIGGAYIGSPVRLLDTSRLLDVPKAPRTGVFQWLMGPFGRRAQPYSASPVVEAPHPFHAPGGSAKPTNDLRR